MSKNTEKEQSIIRIIIICLFLIYLFLLPNHDVLPEVITPLIINGTFGYLFLSLVLFAMVSLDLGYAPVRRISGVLMDITMTTISMCYLSSYGAPLFVGYLWVMVGNGFRFGIKYLAICTFLSIAGFLLVSRLSSYWAGMPAMIWMGMLILILIPAYFAILLRRVQIEKTNAEAANNEKSRFLANISHEIRTPLNAIVGFSGLIEKMKDDAEKRRLMKRIQDASASLLALVDDVLDFSRIEAGHMKLVHEDVNIYSLALSIQGMFEAQVKQKNIKLSLHITPSVGPLILSDEKRLRQVFVNLVGNAVKFTQMGEIILRIDNARIGSRPALQVEVIDTGEGIPEDVQPYIFDRFRQADYSVNRRHGGAGLGTSIAKQLVDLMGGEIGLESVLGKGSKFWFRIPNEYSSQQRKVVVKFPVDTNIVLVTKDAEQGERIIRMLDDLLTYNVTVRMLFSSDVDNYVNVTNKVHCIIADCVALQDSLISSLPARLSNKNSCYIAFATEEDERTRLLELGYNQVACAAHELKNALVYNVCKVDASIGMDSGNALQLATNDDRAKRILIAEDSDMNRQVFKGILEDMGREVIVANTGIEALKRLYEEAFDLFIVDIQMPGMSGFEVIDRYKTQIPQESRIPIVVVTGDVTKEVHEKCVELGVDRFLAKPVESVRLRKVVAELLSNEQHVQR